MADEFDGREIARRYWSWDAMVEDFVRLYDKIAQSKR
jgi:hypothetical protein